MRESARENDKAVHQITADAMERLVNYSWPGNVRELRSAIETAVVLCRSDTITVRELPPEVRAGVAVVISTAPRPPAAPAGGLAVKDAEKQLIIRALKEANRNRTEAAKKLGMSRRTLHRKLHTYSLEHL
jgi:two-component system response regulator HydG